MNDDHTLEFCLNSILEHKGYPLKENASHTEQAEWVNDVKKALNFMGGGHNDMDSAKVNALINPLMQKKLKKTVALTISTGAQALEYLRGKTGNSFGNLFSMLTILKGLPLSYFKDLQDDKELVFNSFDQIKNSILILIEVLQNFTPNKKRMYELANIGYTTSTDLADYIVKCYGLPFRKAYQITSKIVNYAESKNIKLSELTLKELKKIEPKLNEDALKVFNLENSIKSKKSYGGTSFENVKKMIKKYKKESK